MICFIDISIFITQGRGRSVSRKNQKTHDIWPALDPLTKIVDRTLSQHLVKRPASFKSGQYYWRLSLQSMNADCEIGHWSRLDKSVVCYENTFVLSFESRDRYVSPPYRRKFSSPDTRHLASDTHPRSSLIYFLILSSSCNVWDFQLFVYVLSFLKFNRRISCVRYRIWY